MKKIFTLPNIIAAILLLLAVAETVLMILFKPLPLWAILLEFFGAVLVIAMIRFARQIAYFNNWLYSFLYQRNVREKENEPSGLAVGLVKVSGYVVLLMLQVILFL